MKTKSFFSAKNNAEQNPSEGKFTKWVLSGPGIIIRWERWLVISFVFLIPTGIYAQRFSGLNHLPNHQSKVYYSDGTLGKATRIAGQMDKVMLFYDPVLWFRPEVTLLVLSPQDWSKYTSFPVYGMPHYSDNKTLIVASEDNDFWKSFIPPMELVPEGIADLVKKTYQSKEGQLSMEPFFDLLAIHELGHAYHFQDSLVMQRKWMQELFVNLFLHTYIAENEPEQLSPLTAFPEMVLAITNKSSLKFTTLQDLENRYDEIGQQYPNNYGWYQCRWHKASAEIYDEAGKEAVKKLWTLLKHHCELLDDSAFTSVLAGEVHQKVADVQLKWDEQ